jgi:hypothetical protein
MAGMLNQAEQNPSGLLADCIRMAAASHLERRCNVPLLQQGIKKEQYESCSKKVLLRLQCWLPCPRWRVAYRWDLSVLWDSQV